MEPLTNPYLWALGAAAHQLAPGSIVGSASVANRYQVIAPQVWLDTQPAEPPTDDRPGGSGVHRELLPYLYLHGLRLHLPLVYGVCPTPQGTVVLLENAPLEGAGRLLPRLDAGLAQASPLRQLNWLWQCLDLWNGLARWGVAASLLVPDNLRVQGGIVRLRELYGGLGQDPPLGAGLDSPTERYASPDTRLPTIADLGQLWQTWIPACAPPLQGPLFSICQQLQTSVSQFEPALEQLNELLLRETARSPVKLTIAGQTDPGQTQYHNEDRCFPVSSDLTEPALSQHADLVPHLVMVCDGIGGHEGGEVASQLALRSMKLQIQALFQDLLHASPGAILPPSVIAEQLAASVRVVNNLITAQNDLQNRSDRQRMATTLVMVLHLQQSVSGDPSQKSHELYVLHLGDSRAYWMTQKTCHALTVDDDVACREVRMGRSFYRVALQREDAQSLTQALGTRSGEALHVHIQRFIADEDGVFFLCSDGLSDNGWVERYWNGSIAALLSEMETLEEIAQEWITLGKQRNGQDNLSVALMKCQVSPPPYGILLDPFPDGSARVPQEILRTPEEELSPELPDSLDLALPTDQAPLEAFEDPLTEASAALMAETATVPGTDPLDKPPPVRRKKGQGWILLFGGTGLFLLALAGVVVFLWFNSTTVRSLINDRFLHPTPSPEKTR